MKITNVECLPVQDGRNCVFVVVETDEGLFGVGEAGLTGRAGAIGAAVQDYAARLVGQDPLRIEHHWQTLSRGFFFPHDRIAGSALAAVDIALWDLMGKALGVPVYQLLGGRVRDKVVCYPHTGGRTPEELVERCLALREEGWKFVRFSPNTGPDGLFEPGQAARESVAMFEAVRKALGDSVEICFDIHTRLDPADAIQLCRAVEPYRPFFMEDPIRSEGSNSFRLLRQHINVPLAAGEQYCSKWEFRQIIEEDLIDYARVDLCICGGITESRKVAAMAETHYIKLATHNPLGPVSSRRLPAPQPGQQQRGGDGAAPAPRAGDDQRRPPAGAVGGRLPPAPHRPRPGDRVRPRGRPAPALPARRQGPDLAAPRRRLLHQLVAG